MVLGGLAEGVTPLGWTYAYSTIGNDGDRVSGTLAPRPGDSPVSIAQVTNDDGETIKGGDNDSMHDQVFDQGTVEEAKGILETVVSSGTGTNAQIGAEGQWGKTGTTEENVDAWFCGGVADEVTACVWVGYPDSATPMTTLYNGGPVMGGTFPALIWARVISAWEAIKAEHAAEKAARKAAKEAGEDPDSAEIEEGYVAPETEGYVSPEEGEYEAPEAEAVEPEAETEAAPEATPEEATPEATPESGGGGGITAGYRPGLRDVGAAGGAEAPGAVDGFGDSDPRAGDDRGQLARWRRQVEGVAAEIGLVVGEADAQRLGQLARAGTEPDIRTLAAALSHRFQAMGWLQGPDQDCGGIALRFGDRVEQAVDAVGEVDVGVAGRSEQDPGALGKTNVGVAGGIVGVVTLGLDDDTATSLVEKRATDQVSGDSVDRSVEEISPQRLCEPLGPAPRP